MIHLTRRNLLASAAAAGAVLAGPTTIVAPANAAAPAAGKQNAGWYRYKVGSFEVTVVTDGMNSNPLSDAYVANAPKADVTAALAADFLPQDKVSHSYTPVVVNTGQSSWRSTPASGSACSTRARVRSASITAISRPPGSTVTLSML